MRPKTAHIVDARRSSPAICSHLALTWRKVEFLRKTRPFLRTLKVPSTRCEDVISNVITVGWKQRAQCFRRLQDRGEGWLCASVHNQHYHRPNYHSINTMDALTKKDRMTDTT